MTGRTVTVDLAATVELTEAEIWPGGDAPDAWDLDDVRKRMEADGPKANVLGEWCLLDDLDVHLSDADGATAEVWP